MGFTTQRSVFRPHQPAAPPFTFPLTQLGIARPPATLRSEQLGLGQEGWRAWCYGGFEPTEGSGPYFLPSQCCRESTEAWTGVSKAFCLLNAYDRPALGLTFPT